MSSQILRFPACSHICDGISPEGGYMPVVQIYMYAGRSKEQKSELVKRISKDFEEVVNVKSESLNILFHDMDKEDWGIRGSLASDPPSK
jgi:4-oxalocrotonate tautomerase